jgi:hypothetical protein
MSAYDVAKSKKISSAGYLAEGGHDQNRHKESIFFLAANSANGGGSTRCASRDHVPMGVTAHGSPSGPLQFDRLGSRPWPPMRRDWAIAPVHRHYFSSRKKSSSPGTIYKSLPPIARFHTAHIYLTHGHLAICFVIGTDIASLHYGER